MARERGYSSSGYWWAFGLPIAISIALSVALVVSLVLSAHQINDNLSVGSGTVPAPATTPATSPAATKPAPRGGSGDTAPGAITTSASCPPDLSATLNKPSWASPPPMSINPSGTYTATVTTDVGSFTIQLDPAAAPETVNSFVFLAQHRYYDCVVFHRVIQTFMDQTGDPTGTGEGGPGYQFADELPSQATPQYPIGSVAMANSGPNTNGSQFFIVTGSEGEDLPPSYSLFGRVISGMDVVDKINADGSASSSSTGTPTNLHRMISVTISES